MPKSLADGHTKLALFATKPADIEKLKVADFTDSIDASCRILSTDYNVGPQASETVDEKALCVPNNAQALGASNYQFEITSFRYFDKDGKAEVKEGDDIGDAVYQMLKKKGTTIWAVERFTSKESKEAWAEGDEYSWYEVTMDVPQPAERSGFIKARHVGLPQDGALDKIVAA